MTAPRLEIDLEKIYHNACTLHKRLASRGISITGVTKATSGSAEIARAFLRAGIYSLGDSRIENVEAMRCAGVPGLMTLIRSPMLSQAKCVVKFTDVSFNTEIAVIKKLSVEAVKADRIHGVVLMVELGDLREGIMPDDLMDTVAEMIKLPNIVFKGIGTNLACRSGVVPDVVNMTRLSELADAIEKRFELSMEIVSGGNSASLDWAFSDVDKGRVNDLRLGEAILLGCETLHRQNIEGLYTDSITLVAEVIESKLKPSKPTGEIAQSAFGDAPLMTDRGQIHQAILAIGVQDIDPEGLHADSGIRVTGASSDHLIVESDNLDLVVGAEVTFQLNYSALLRAMTSPYISRVMTPRRGEEAGINSRKTRLSQGLNSVLSRIRLSSG